MLAEGHDHGHDHGGEGKGEGKDGMDMMEDSEELIRLSMLDGGKEGGEWRKSKWEERKEKRRDKHDINLMRDGKTLKFAVDSGALNTVARHEELEM